MTEKTTHVKMRDKDRVRVKKLAKELDRTMQAMWTIIVDDACKKYMGKER